MVPSKIEADFPTEKNLEAAFTPGRFALLLVLLICASFPALVTGSGTFFCRDFGLFTFPVTHWQQASWLRGEVPLWNPLNCCGVPFLAQWNTAVLYPPAIICLIFPLSWSLGIFFLGHLLLAGLGVYFLAFRWTGNRFGAAVAGTTFTFSAVLLNCLMWTSNLAAMAWMPWVVLAVERAWHDGGRTILIAALAGALQMLAGAPELILLTWVFLGTLFLEHFFLSAKSFRWRAIRRFLAVVLVVGGLCAAQLLPFIDLVKHSDRDANYTADDWSMPGWGLANFLIPLYRACPTVFGIYTQPGQFWIFSYYAGIGTVALALLACRRASRPRIWLLAALTVLCLVFALGEHGLVYSSLRRVLPQLSLMRYPIKFVVLPALIIPLLAAFSIDDFMTRPEISSLRRRTLILFFLIITLIGWLIWTVYHQPPAYISWLVTMKSALTRIGFLAAILGLLCVLRKVSRPPAQVLAGLGFILLFWLDAMTNGPRPNPVAPTWIYQPDLARKESHFETPPELGKSRLMVSGEADRNMRFSDLADPAQSYVYCRLAMFDDCNLLDGIPKVDGFFSLYGREPAEVLGALYSARQPASGLLDFLAVSQLTSPGKNIDWKYRPTHRPWVTAGEKPVFAGREKTLAALVSPEFDPRTTVYLPSELANSVIISNASTPQILATQFSSQKIALQVTATEPALVVVAQTFYHCWQAYLDGQPVEILRANHAFQAVAIPAGAHHLEFVYADRMFRAGTIISLLTLAGCMVCWFWKFKSAHTNSR
jgi:hypothetical protein